MRAIPLCLVLLALPAFAADELGRLFFTPEQRALLDLARRALLDLARRAQPSASQAALESYEGVTLSGVVTRSDGKRTVWINGQPQTVGDGAAGGRSPASAAIPLPGGEGKIRLKVGQTLDPSSGKVEEEYRRAPKAAPPAPVSGAPSTPAKASARTPAANGDDDQADDARDGATR